MKTRIVWTKIWEDEWFCKLDDPTQKLFLYLITNQRINLCGCYEISDRVISFDTRIKDLTRAKSDLKPKALFFEGWVYLPNAVGYSGYVGESNERARDKEIALIPLKVKNALLKGKVYPPLTGGTPHPHTTINHKSEIINHKSEIRSKGYESCLEVLGKLKRGANEV